MNDDNQTTESFSSQEDLQEIEEQALEGVTGGGLLGKCFACFKAPQTIEGPASPGLQRATSNSGRVLPPTIHFAEVGSGKGMSVDEVGRRLERNQSVTVERGSQSALHAGKLTGRI